MLNFARGQTSADDTMYIEMINTILCKKKLGRHSCCFLRRKVTLVGLKRLHCPRCLLAYSPQSMMLIYTIESEIEGKITGPCNIGQGQMWVRH